MVLKRAESFPNIDGYEVFWKEAPADQPAANKVCVFVGHRKDRKIPLRMEFLLGDDIIKKVHYELLKETLWWKRQH